MKERPILFSGEMVRAILEGRKTQTRRMIKPQPASVIKNEDGSMSQGDYNGSVDFLIKNINCPYGQPGDRLWVRETWGICPDYNCVRYKADRGVDSEAVGGKWHPSIHMRREYSRINLEITNIRVERLQDISEEDAKSEGIEELEIIVHNEGTQFLYGIDPDSANSKFVTDNPISSYKELWEKINGPGSWDKNPFVRVVEFKRVW